MLFGVPSRKKVASVKLEKYPNTAVLTLPPFKGKGFSRTLEFNKLASEVLGFNFELDKVQVSFSFDEMNDTVIVANTTGLSNVAEIKVAKNLNASDKKYYEAIKAHFSSDDEEELELELKESGEEFNGFKTLLLSRISTNTAYVADASSIEVEQPEILNATHGELGEEIPDSVLEELAIERDNFEAAVIEEEAQVERPAIAGEGFEAPAEEDPFVDFDFENN